MKFSDWSWVFVGSVIGIAGCAEDHAVESQRKEPGKVNVDVRDGVDVDVRHNRDGRPGGVDVEVKDGKVNVDVK
jgi:hypothetical protein